MLEIESTGKVFESAKLIEARDVTLKVIELTSQRVEEGMSKADILGILEILKTELGVSQNWHAPQIRIGEETLLPFGRPGVENIKLKKNDIYFIDLGLVFKDHEGDVGRTFCLGEAPLMSQCIRDAEKIWKQVQKYWKKDSPSGQELYAYAQEYAKSLGWQLNLEKANGHRISDFPHAARMRNSIEGLSHPPLANRWILEIQIKHPELSFGAFYEDLLN